MHILEWTDRLGREQSSQFVSLFDALARKDELETQQYTVLHYFLD
jgi:hypothetical protein